LFISCTHLLDNANTELGVAYIKCTELSGIGLGLNNEL